MNQAPPRRELRDLFLPLFVLLVAGFALYLQARRYYPLFVDDGFISLRYSRRLLEGRGLTWTDGERVEGYSNLLWVLGCAALGLFQRDLVVAARVLGAASALATLVAVLRRYSGRDLSACAPGAAGVLGLALAGPFCVWATAGMEQPLVAALLSWSAVALYPLLEKDRAIAVRDVLPAGVLLGLLAITRPDTGLFTAVACLTVLVGRPTRRDGLRVALLLGAIATTFALAQLAFRRVYYDEWVANTALAKVSLSRRRVCDGLRSLRDGAACLWPLAAPALGLGAAAFIAPGTGSSGGGRRARVGFVALGLIVWSAYVLFIGGDNFPAHRPLVPHVVLLSLALAEGVAWAVERGGSARSFAPVLTAGCLSIFGFLQSRDPGNRAALAPTARVRENESTGLLLRRAFGTLRPVPLLAVDAAGVVPYYSELPSLDMLGLCDRFLTHHRPASFGNGHLGHELGDGNYVLDRAPDLILSGIGGAPVLTFLAGRQMTSDPRFVDGYLLTNIGATEPVPVNTYLFVRKEGRAGNVRTDGRVLVPGLFFATGLRPRVRGAPTEPELFVAHLEAGTLATLVPVGTTASYDGLQLDPGAWHARVIATGPDPLVTVTVDVGAPVESEQGPVAIDVPAGAKVQVSVRARRAAAHIRGVLFTRD